ncbi:hypothetical protein A3B87_01475 [Candidatus Kuenenbacteria bacterium RIFCSPHIGHO2_02_FULL_39_13]|uniref:Uncharacterized protein n=1 Tax=Candidatus Kuenenbacteria bacterium RIFCSPHIGHO2_02_FULL_39_13 TaxID=1798561 RepID=A0A1F6FNR8_9BACT|nr:MAG: hypothetical protein A3B87_01475 [Candidatus Kuenenbacteria bacterium RIFCSPHIGHO2_02_FULL_39_13]
MNSELNLYEAMVNKERQYTRAKSMKAAEFKIKRRIILIHGRCTITDIRQVKYCKPKIIRGITKDHSN